MLKRRSQRLAQVRSHLSKDDDMVDQMKDELKHLEQEEREKILKDEGFCMALSAEKGLVMKADLGIPWNTLRKLKRYSLHSNLVGSIHVHVHVHAHVH